MATMFVYGSSSSGSESLTDQLSGTAVATAGATGIVRAVFSSSLMENTASLVGRQSGISIIPSGSHPNVAAAANTYSLGSEQFVFVGTVGRFEALDLTLTVSGASDNIVAVQVE